MQVSRYLYGMPMYVSRLLMPMINELSQSNRMLNQESMSTGFHIDQNFEIRIAAGLVLFMLVRYSVKGTVLE
jgi:hypothetical protein